MCTVTHTHLLAASKKNMSIEIIPINGKTDFFDYEAFEESVKSTIGRRCSDAKIFLLNNFLSFLVHTIKKKIGSYFQ